MQVDPASRYMGSLLLAVQKEEPEFILLRMDAPAATLTLCGLPGNMQLAAPSGTTTLAAAYLAAGPARAAQLLGDTLGTAPQHYLAATPSCYASFWEQGTTVRLDMAALQEDTDPHQNFVAEIEAATAETALRDLGAEQTDAGAARLLAAYTAALFRQNPQQLAALPEEIRLAARDYDPSRINRFVIDLASAFHRFYGNCRIQGADPAVQQARLALCIGVKNVIFNVLTMFKINVPEKM